MKPIRVLLVDDEIVFTNNMARLLEHRGYVVSAVNSGDKALDVIAERVFDVVVLDLKMPGLDGLATLREIRDTCHACQVLILTGHGAVDSAFEAMRLGAYDYLTKPCEIAEMVEKIEDARALMVEMQEGDLDERIERLVNAPPRDGEES